MPLPLLAALSLGQAALGAFQSATSGRKKAERELDNFAKAQPLATESKSINDYYQRRLNAANENVYTSAPYLISKQEADRRLLGGMNALQDRKGGIGGIGKLDLMRTDALNQAIRNAESVKGANISGLGQAAQMKNAQDRYIFDINQMTPYNRMFGLKQMASQAANERYNAGLNMIGGAASNYAMGSMFGGAGKLKNKVSPLNNSSELNPASTFATNYIPFNSYNENTPLNQGASAFNDYRNRLGSKSKLNSFGTNYNF